MWISRALLVAVTRLRLAAARADDRLARSGHRKSITLLQSPYIYGVYLKPHLLLLRYKKPYITLDTAFALHTALPDLKMVS